MTIFDHEESNKTRYGLESAAQRYTWAGYYLFVILSSLIGDTTILVGSIKHQAIKLHEFIVTIIQHIAVCDLLVIATHVLPMFVTLLAEKWVFGELLCRVLIHVAFYVNQASILLICTMTTSKLLLIRYPLRFGTISSKKTHILCGVCWGVALVWPVLMLAVDRNDVYFSYISYFCAYDFSAYIWEYLAELLNLLLIILPTCIIVATSVNLLLIAKKVASRRREGLKWQGIITTLLTATVFCVSLLPLTVMMALRRTSLKKSIIELTVVKALWRIALSLVYLNTTCNFYIYCLTVTSFRDFVRSRLQLLTQKLTFSATRGIEAKFYTSL